MTISMQMEVESPTKNRRQPLLLAKAMGIKEEKQGRNGNRIGEVAGGTTAECAAVCCCCPCAMMHLIVLAVYRVPAGLCKKALKKRKRKRLLRRKNKNLLEQKENQRMTMKRNSGPTGIHGGWDGLDDADIEGVGVIEAVDLDPEMLDLFYSGGFWRSSSQRED